MQISFTVKCTADPSAENKARLVVAKDFTQTTRVNYQEKISQFTKMNSI